MMLPRNMELQWRREVIEKWLTSPSIPPDARTALLEMLKDVNEEVAKLDAESSHFDDLTKRRAS